MRITRIVILVLLGIILVSGLACGRGKEPVPTHTPTPTPMPSPIPTMLFSDNFSDPSSGWLTQSYKSGGSALYKNGWLHIRDDCSSYYATTSYAKQHLTDFVLEVEGKLVDGQVYRDRYLKAITEFEEDYGWDFEDTLAYARKEGPKWEQYQDMLKMVSPEEQESLFAGILEKVDMAVNIQRKYSMYVSEENWYVVYCRSDRLNNYYTFAISAEGRYFAQKTVNGHITFLITPEYSTRIHSGKDVTNLIHIECVENTLSLSVNEHLLAKVKDNTFNSGDIELGALVSYSLYTEVAYDNIVVTAP